MKISIVLMLVPMTLVTTADAEPSAKVYRIVDGSVVPKVGYYMDAPDPQPNFQPCEKGRKPMRVDGTKKVQVHGCPTGRIGLGVDAIYAVLLADGKTVRVISVSGIGQFKSTDMAVDEWQKKNGASYGFVDLDKVDPVDGLEFLSKEEPVLDPKFELKPGVPVPD